MRTPANRMKNWRIMGMWEDGREMLVVLGRTEAECRRLLPDAIADLTVDDLRRVDSLWLEEWTYEEFRDESRWIPTAEIPLRNIRLRAAALRQHAMARSA